MLCRRKADLAQGSEILAEARFRRPPTARERDYVLVLSVFFSDTDKLDHNLSKYAVSSGRTNLVDEGDSRPRPPHCERGITKAKTRRHNQLVL